jgi:hypothetical protein
MCVCCALTHWKVWPMTPTCKFTDCPGKIFRVFFFCIANGKTRDSALHGRFFPPKYKLVSSYSWTQFRLSFPNLYNLPQIGSAYGRSLFLQFALHSDAETRTCVRVQPELPTTVMTVAAHLMTLSYRAARYATHKDQKAICHCGQSPWLPWRFLWPAKMFNPGCKYVIHCRSTYRKASDY